MFNAMLHSITAVTLYDAEIVKIWLAGTPSSQPLYSLEMITLVFEHFHVLFTITCSYIILLPLPPNCNQLFLREVFSTGLRYLDRKMRGYVCSSLL